MTFLESFGGSEKGCGLWRRTYGSGRGGGHSLQRTWSAFVFTAENRRSSAASTIFATVLSSFQRNPLRLVFLNNLSRRSRPYQASCPRPLGYYTDMYLLPIKKELTYKLRPRSHDFVLPNYNTSKLSYKAFFKRVLSKNMY